jgi:hypothetical protein
LITLSHYASLISFSAFFHYAISWALPPLLLII